MERKEGKEKNKRIKRSIRKGEDSKTNMIMMMM